MPRHQLEEARMPAGVDERPQPLLILPPFTPDRAAMWFLQAENSFILQNIDNDAVKYVTAILSFSPQQLDQVDDVLSDPTASYEKFKSVVLSRFTETESARIRRRLESEEMGDRTPSQFYRHLQMMATPDISESMLLTLWKARLPPDTQCTLAGLVEQSADIQMSVADAFHAFHDLHHALRPGEARHSEQFSAATQGWRATNAERQNRLGELNNGIAELIKMLASALNIRGGRQTRCYSHERRRRRAPLRRY